MKLNFTTKTEITEEFIEAMLVTALEGGSNYWYWLDGEELNKWHKEKQPLVTSMIEFISESPDNEVIIYDAEEFDGEDVGKESDSYLGVISQASIKKGTKKFLNEYPASYKAAIDETYDAGDADIWMQLVVMDEVVYG
jgi:hypothetical protein